MGELDGLLCGCGGGHFRKLLVLEVEEGRTHDRHICDIVVVITLMCLPGRVRARPTSSHAFSIEEFIANSELEF